jgi:hypothetical protein
MVYFEAFTPFFAADLGRLPMESCELTRERGNPVDLDLALIDVPGKSR